MSKLKNEELRRYWFESSRNLRGINLRGIGVTAYSLSDAKIILNSAIKRHKLDVEIIETIEDVDIRNLDQGHVIPNMNPPNFRGVWYPMFNAVSYTHLTLPTICSV